MLLTFPSVVIMSNYHECLSSCYNKICVCLASLSSQRPSSRLCPSPPTWLALCSTALTLLWRPTVAPSCFICSVASNGTFLGTPIPHWTTLCVGSTMTSSRWSTAASSTPGSAARRPSPTRPPLLIVTTACGWRARMSAPSDPTLASWWAACPVHSGRAEHWADCWDWPERLWMRPRRQRYPESVDVA